MGDNDDDDDDGDLEDMLRRVLGNREGLEANNRTRVINWKIVNHGKQTIIIL